jgi:hypothetical protein
METLKFITFTDVHVSSINPASRLGSYENDIIDKLKQIKRAGEKTKTDFFLFGGDLFNLKAPMRNPHELNSRLINLFKSFPAPIYSTEGNHDLRNDSYTTFDEQPLNVIYASGALVQARDIRFTAKGLRVRVRSFPFQEVPDLKSLPRAKDGTTDLDICLLHLYASPKGGMLFHQVLFAYDEIAELGDDIFLLGHYHIDQGIEFIEPFGRNQVFINVGAVGRGTTSEDDLNRTPKIGLVEVTKTESSFSIKCQAARLAVRPATEVFDLKAKEEDTKRHKDAEEFVSKLQADTITSTEGDGEDRVKSELSGMSLEKAVVDRVIHFLEEADLQRKVQ